MNYANRYMPKTNNFPTSEPGPKKVVKVPDKDFKLLGLSKNSSVMTEKIEDLRKDAPNIVVAKCTRDVGFVQNFFKEQHLKKNTQYVMELGIYQQLWMGEKKKKILKPAKIRFNKIYRPYQGQPLDNKTLMVSRTGGIGDLLFIQPNLRYLKEQYPTCTIKFSCGPQYQSMVDTWDCVDLVLDLPFKLQHLITADYHAFFEGVIERCKEAHTTNAYHLFTKWMGLNLPDELLLPKQHAKEDKVFQCEKILEKWGVKEKEFILFQLRASSPVRSPDPKVWIEIINRMTANGHKILITDNPKQADGIDRFIKRLERQDMVFNFCRESKSLDYSIAVTLLSRLNIATDSAMIHIAESLKVPSLGLFGPFPGHIRLSTYKYADWIDIEHTCTPCFEHGAMPCSVARKAGVYCSPCYDNLNYDLFIEKAERIING